MISVLFIRRLLSGNYEVFQYFGSDNSCILFTDPFSSNPNKRISISFQKDFWDGFSIYFFYLCSPAKKYLFLFLPVAVALSTFLALETVKSFVPFGHIKRQPRVWWSFQVEEAMSEDV